MFNQLTYNDRIKIETMIKLKKSKREIAEYLNVHVSTIYREVPKGQVVIYGKDLKWVSVYSADVAQAGADRKASLKGAKLKIGKNIEYANYIEMKIIEERYSPYAALMAAGDRFDCRICVTTCYSYIRNNVFLSLDKHNIKKYDIKRSIRHPRIIKPLARSIHDRPKEIKDRKIYGHWEMDTVIGKSEKAPCLLVLTERKKRQEIVRIIPEKTQIAVIAALDALEEAEPDFPAKFKTITCDNGCEFLDSQGLERSIHGGTRTIVYYCDPQSAWQRGSNENANRLIRRWIPKGQSMAGLNQTEVEKIQAWMNNYPRRIFQGRSSNQINQSIAERKKESV